MILAKKNYNQNIYKDITTNFIKYIRSAVNDYIDFDILLQESKYASLANKYLVKWFENNVIENMILDAKFKPCPKEVSYFLITPEYYFLLTFEGTVQEYFKESYEKGYFQTMFLILECHPTIYFTKLHVEKLPRYIELERNNKIFEKLCMYKKLDFIQWFRKHYSVHLICIDRVRKNTVKNIQDNTDLLLLLNNMSVNI